jgi:crotonobetainyl-CoA:carnitine CoA-transferase CaiB-like acyl-CoA transferase
MGRAGQMKKPLEGIRIIELSHVISGPFCGMLLGDLGAEMIKVENPDKGEFGRTGGPKTQNGMSLWYPNYNRNKKAITLNLKQPGAREIFLKLIRKSDALLENFRPGMLERIDLGYKDLQLINPRIIMASISGFGKNGPYENKTAYDMTMAALSGLMAVNGLPDVPLKTGPAITDFVSGLYGALAIVAAIRYRDQTGKGQFIDVAMMDSAMSILDTFFAEVKVLGKEPARVGNRRANNAPINLFKARDGYIFIAAGNQGQWEKLCKLMEHEELLVISDYETPQSRYKHAEALERLIADWAKDKTVTEVEQMLSKESIACAPLKTLPEVLEDPNVKARHSFSSFDYPGIGEFPTVALTPRFSEVRWELNRPPLLGENNKEIYCGLLGYTEEEYSSIQASGIV